MCTQFFNKLCWIILLSFCFIKIKAQKEFSTHIKFGYFNTPWDSGRSGYQNPTPGKYFGFGCEYNFTRKVSFKFSVLSGNHRYYDAGIFTNDPTHGVWPDGTNSSVYNFIVGSEILFKIISLNRFSLKAGTGIGILNFVRTFTTRTEFDQGGRHIIHWNNLDQSAFHDLLFPVSMILEYRLRKKIGLFLDTGAFVEPDFPIMGLHIGLGGYVTF